MKTKKPAAIGGGLDGKREELNQGHQGKEYDALSTTPISQIEIKTSSTCCPSNET